MHHTPHRRKYRTWITVASISVGLFVLLNGLVALVYAQRVYPHSTLLGVNVGNLTFHAAQNKLRNGHPLPTTLKLTYHDQRKTVPTADLGITLDTKKLPDSARQGRSWLPVWNLFVAHELAAPVAINQQRFAKTAGAIAADFRREPTPAHIVSGKNNAFKAVQAQAGHQLDTDKLQAAITNGIARNGTITVPVRSLPPAARLSDPNKSLQTVQGQLATPLTYHFNGKSAKATPQDIAGWYTQSGDGFAVSSSAVRSYIITTGARLGSTPQNIDQAVNTTLSALASARASNIKLFNKVKVLNYCVALRGVSNTQLPELEKRAAAAYQDPRGWSLEGQVIFKQVASGCDFTVWLVAANQMPSFGTICDSTWSCTVGSNVVINFDRWQSATASWNAARAGTIDEYRIMAINHETGHEMGFNHSNCPVAGQPAPIMEQQSIDLQGCKFSIWPDATEQAALRARFGL